MRKIIRLTMLVNGPDTLSHALSGADLDLYLIIVSYSPCAKQHLDRFYPFYRAHGRHQQTARHAHRHTEIDHATVRQEF